ncbi:hypothetical protein AVEN_121536-1 [Araneus ventricosus]|uniref:Cathepsin propeptide inhibitor domain-containing protein n=1 Tax=Araneus ventricosus TaxID=182803 RepID=A0A4Y2GPD0_ARAVE|nr:hypothetical protein AVEN_121536-1 [Araneus ventricosus]
MFLYTTFGISSCHILGSSIFKTPRAYRTFGFNKYVAGPSGPGYGPGSQGSGPGGLDLQQQQPAATSGQYGPGSRTIWTLDLEDMDLVDPGSSAAASRRCSKWTWRIWTWKYRKDHLDMCWTRRMLVKSQELYSEAFRKIRVKGNGDVNSKRHEFYESRNNKISHEFYKAHLGNEICRYLDPQRDTVSQDHPWTWWTRVSSMAAAAAASGPGGYYVDLEARNHLDLVDGGYGPKQGMFGNTFVNRKIKGSFQ